MRTTAIVALVVVGLVGCGSKKTDAAGSTTAAAGSSGGSGDASAKSPAKAAAPPGGGFVTPPLGPPDAIEPPSRDIVPGMLLTVAKEKGAKPDTVDFTLKWRPDTDLWVNKDLQVVSNLQVEYPAKDWDAVRAKWGKPAIGEDVWIGANWMAKLNGCANGPCGVTFVRSPLTFLEKTPVPPGPLANLRYGMKPDEIKKATGYAISKGNGSDNGFGWDLMIDYTSDDELEALDMDIQTGKEDDWLPGLSKLWGEPISLGSDKVWLNEKDGWMVQFGDGGTLLTFKFLKPVSSLLAKTGDDSFLALAKNLLGKPKAELAKTPGYDVKRERFRGFLADYSTTYISFDTQLDDKDEISAVELVIETANEPDAEKLKKRITDAFGPITKSKDERDEEIQTMSVDGIKIKIEADASRTKLVATK